MLRYVTTRGVLVLLLVVAAVGCGSGSSEHGGAAPGSATTVAVEADAGVPVGRSSETIVVDGVSRTYHLYRPAQLSSPAPLVVMIHGGFGSGTQAETAYRWDQQADAGHFMVVYPDGLDRAWNVEGGGCCGSSARDDVDDVGFITQMVNEIGQSVAIDASRVYATGMSNGAIMSYTLACHTDLFAAIAPVAGTQLTACPDPNPVSIIHIHGLDDQNVPFDGGEGQGVAKIDGPAVASVVAQWRTIDDCQAPTVSSAEPVTTSTASCADGRAVELVTIEGAGHQWPGSVPRTGPRPGDPPSQALDATETIWQFFSNHPK